MYSSVVEGIWAGCGWKGGCAALGLRLALQLGLLLGLGAKWHPSGPHGKTHGRTCTGSHFWLSGLGLHLWFHFYTAVFLPGLIYKQGELRGVLVRARTIFLSVLVRVRVGVRPW